MLTSKACSERLCLQSVVIPQTPRLSRLYSFEVMLNALQQEAMLDALQRKRDARRFSTEWYA